MRRLAPGWGAKAIRPFKEDMAHAWFRASFRGDDRFIERSKSNPSPVQAWRRPPRDAVEVSNNIASLEFGEPEDGDL